MSGPRLSIIPAAAVVDPRLEGRDLQVLALLGCHTNDDGWCRRSQVRMADQLRCARSTIQAALTRLMQAGWVEYRAEDRRDGGTASHWYRVRLDISDDESRAAGAEILIGDADRKASSNSRPPADLSAPPADLSAPPAGPGSAGPAGPGSAPLTTDSNDADLTHPQPPRGQRETRAQASKSAPEDAVSGGGDADGEDEAGFELFFAAWLAAEPRHASDPKRPALAVWRKMSERDRVSAANPDALAGVVADQRRAGRRNLLSAATYLRERMWERARPAKAASGAFAPLPAWSRSWWCRWWRLVKDGARDGEGRYRRSVMLASDMAVAARRGEGVSVPLEDCTAIETEAASFSYVLTASPEFAAWRAWFEARGVTIPKPDRVDRVFLPSLTPPEA